ncbi:hypothetical protein GXP67_14345 [Rhodocytophaga rosea]|uniref:Uncharacterized protein n=1 Tax=Rhodocytophaga rosea TaxID=2704465 RepID=A0A6C0GIA6_9BACT|nr:hypothetical protein [Rhodocytophaga rosea]QHT67728.1 hypothetical protein GXP67_14345 [Rhodocytophaga rosea]
MRVVANIPHEACKITVFAWNGKYLIKFEQAMLEQTYKVNEFDITGDNDIKKLLDDVFMNQILERFHQMHRNLNDALERI